MFDGLMAEMRGLRKDIEDLRVRKDVLRREIELTDEVVNLKKQISELEIKRSKIQEDHAKENRELRHMIGLEKKRQEFEIESSKKEAILSVREENLAADRKRFEEQLKFHEDRFAQEVGYLKEIMGQILARLPDISVNLDGRKGREYAIR